jgi:hypothetical protein
MREFSLHPGVWTASLGLCFGGVFAVRSAPTGDVVFIGAGWLSIFLGVAVAIWGVKFDGSHWWRKPRTSLRKPAKTERGQRLVESLRVARASDPLAYLAHIEFVSSAQRGLAMELDGKFQLAGWQTNFRSVPYDRYPQRHAIGIEVSGYNNHITDMVTEILNSLGYGPASSQIKNLTIQSDNPKWPLAQRTVYLFLGHPPG